MNFTRGPFLPDAETFLTPSEWLEARQIQYRTPQLDHTLPEDHVKYDPESFTMKQHPIPAHQETYPINTRALSSEEVVRVQNARLHFQREMLERHEKLKKDEEVYGKVQWSSNVKHSLRREKSRLSKQRLELMQFNDQEAIHENSIALADIQARWDEFLKQEVQYRQDCIMKLREEKSAFYHDFPALGNKYILIKMIGYGGSAEVWRVLDILTNGHVALKISTCVQQIQQEHKLHSALVHLQIVPVDQEMIVFQHHNLRYGAFAMDEVSSDLSRMLRQYKHFDEISAREIIYQLLVVVQYMHEEKHIAHFDLKPHNLLLHEDGRIQLTDFHLVKRAYDVVQVTGEGTPKYLPPECYDRIIYGERQSTYAQVDMWSVGIIFFQLLYGDHPIAPGSPTLEQLKLHLLHFNGNLYFPSRISVSQSAKNLIKWCLNPDFTQRPTARDMLSHSFFEPLTRRTQASH